MRQFAQKGFRISQLSREAKVLYTFFSLASMLALGSSALYYQDLVGAGLDGARAYYAGDAPAAGGAGGSAGGPEIELPDEEAARAPISVPMSYRKLLEVTHFHLFTIPVFLLIVAHLFLLTPIRPGAKLAWILAGTTGALAHVAAPWIVRYGGGRLAVVMPATGLWMMATMTVLTGYPVVAMWRPEPERRDPS